MLPAKLARNIQLTFVITLFAGSISIILYNVVAVQFWGRRDAQVREQLRTAARQMAMAAVPQMAQWADAAGADFDQRLRNIAAEVLATFPGAEGGFFLGSDRDRFSGYAYPTSPHNDLPPIVRNEPPPLEAPYIRLQARESLVDDPGQSPIQDYVIGSSRVFVSVEPVGMERPAPAAAWVMIRLTGPEQMESRLGRTQVSLGLALAGMVASFLLLVNLGRSLARQRRDQDRLRDELRRSEQLASLGRLLAGVAHEVRTPLAGLRSTVQLWQRLPETNRDPATLAAVIAAVDRLNEIVARLLYFTRSDQGDRESLDVNALLRETSKLVEASANEQRVAIDLNFDPNVPPIIGSAGGLRQVFLNLAANALQSMPAGGQLTIGSKALSGRQGVEIRFADTGPGISPEERKHLFEPFFTTRVEGAGLGLALCREIISQHSGTIDCELVKGPGAVFRIELPRGDVR